MEHTKGPWIIEDDIGPDIGIYKKISCDDCFIPVCTIHTPDIYNTTEAIAEEAANARLIAAAPSMYDALAAIANMQTQETTEWWELATLCISIAKIEIAKLEGRS